jgi:hypothetical protein
MMSQQGQDEWTARVLSLLEARPGPLNFQTYRELHDGIHADVCSNDVSGKALNGSQAEART